MRIHVFDVLDSNICGVYINWCSLIGCKRIIVSTPWLHFNLFFYFICINLEWLFWIISKYRVFAICVSKMWHYYSFPLHATWFVTSDLYANYQAQLRIFSQKYSSQRHNKQFNNNDSLNSNDCLVLWPWKTAGASQKQAKDFAHTAGKSAQP